MYDFHPKVLPRIREFKSSTYVFSNLEYSHLKNVIHLDIFELYQIHSTNVAIIDDEFFRKVYSICLAIS